MNGFENQTFMADGGRGCASCLGASITVVSGVGDICLIRTPIPPQPNTAVPVSVTRLFQIHPPVASTKWTTRSSLLYGQQSNSDQPMNHVASFYNG